MSQTLIETQCDKLLEVLNAKFEVLGQIKTLLGTDTDLDDHGHYNLHAILSDFQPDTALLCIAAATLEILPLQPSGTAILDMECRRIIQEYAPIWIENADMADVESTDVLDRLIHVPDDLSTLCELLGYHAGVLEVRNPKAAALFDIFQIQAEAQIVIAEDYIDMLTGYDIDEAPEAQPTLVTAQTNNIIRFPIEARAH